MAVSWLRLPDHQELHSYTKTLKHDHRSSYVYDDHTHTCTHIHKHHINMHLVDDLLEVGNMENSRYSKQLQEVEDCNRTLTC